MEVAYKTGSTHCSGSTTKTDQGDRPRGGDPGVVAINTFSDDTTQEVELVTPVAKKGGVFAVVTSDHWAGGEKGHWSGIHLSVV